MGVVVVVPNQEPWTVSNHAFRMLVDEAGPFSTDPTDAHALVVATANHGLFLDELDGQRPDL